MKRDRTGKFIQNWDTEPKRTVTLSLTNTAWQMLEQRSRELNISRSELVERYARNCYPINEFNQQPEKVEQKYSWFRQIVDAIPQIVWTCQPNGQVEYFNQPALDAFGITLEQLFSAGWYPLIYPDDLQPTIDAWTKSVTTGELYELEYRVKMADGSYRWHLARALPARDSAGNITRWFGTCTDIDDRKQLEQALKQQLADLESQSQWLEAVLNLLPTPLILIEPEIGRVVFSNQAANELAGTDISHPDIAGLYNEDYHCTDISGQLIPPDQLPSARALRGEKIQGEELNWHNPQGVYPLLVYAKTLPAMHTRPATSVVVLQNISVRKKAERALKKIEERLSLVLRATNDAIYDCDLETGVVWWNEAYDQVFGKRPDDTTHSWQWWIDHIHPEERSLIVASLNSAIEGTSDRWTAEYRYQLVDGSYADILERSYIVRDQSGKAKRLIGSLLDLTKQKQNEATLRQQAEALENQQKWLEAVLDLMPTPTVFIEPETAKVRFANRIANELAGGDLPKNKSIEEYADFYYCTNANYQRIPTERMPAVLLARGERLENYEVNWHTPKGIRATLCWGETLPPMYGHPAISIVMFQDVTYLKQIEEKLRLSEERYRSLVESLPQLVAMSRPDGTIEYCNQSWINYTGLSQEETRNCGWHQAIHPEDLTIAIEGWRQALIDGHAYSVEFRLKRVDGVYRWYFNKVAPIKREDGNIVAWLAAATDIDEQKRTEQRERLLSQASQTFAAANLDLPTVLDTITRLVSELTGDVCVLSLLSEDRQWLECASFYHSDQELKDFVGKLLENYPRSVHQGIGGRVVQTGLPLLMPVKSQDDVRAAIQPEYRIYLERFQVCSILSLPLKIKGEVIGVLSLNRNLPAEPHNEDDQSLFQDLADRAAMAIANARLYQQAEQARQRAERIADRNARLQSVTASLSEPLTPNQVAQVIAQQTIPVLNATSVLVAIVTQEGDQLEIIHSLGYSQQVDKEWQRFPIAYSSPLSDAVRTGQPMWEESLEERMARYPHLADTYAKSGYAGWISLPLMVEGRAVGGMSITFAEFPQIDQDDRAFMLAIAQQCAQAIARAQLYEAQQQAKAQAEAANRTKDEFLAVLSHELRTPMNPILGWTTLLRKGNLSPSKAIVALDTIERNAKLQVQLIEDLLDISRILQGKLSFQPHRVELSLVIKEALETVRLAAEAKSITIQTNIEQSDAQVLGDPARLQQVVWNLLSNGVKFTHSGGRIEIHLSLIDSLGPNSRYAQIQVVDNGRGIKPNFLPYVFDYFRQADSSTSRTFGGLGLGLAIARHIVELHGGTIKAESLGEGQGACFIVRLPLMSNPTLKDKQEVLMENQSTLEGIQILAVDDEIDNLELITFMLEEAGATVISASSASEAWQIFQQTRPDILVTDIGMPQMDGYSLIHQVRAMPPEQGGQIPAIALTAYAGEVDRQQAITAGFQLHIAKPVEPNALIAAIAQLATSSCA